jgi:hypothetical protein
MPMADDAPKTAYEIAMARLRQKDEQAGVAERPLTNDQKAAIAEARNVYEAKMAEQEILHGDALRRARSAEEIQKLNEERERDRDRLARDRDRQISSIREGRAKTA